MRFTFALSGYYTSLQAKINQSSTLPAAGIAVVLEEGTTIQELTQEVIQNIAYLESASGIQPNIIIASEKVAMAETPMQEEATVDSDVVQALVDSVSGDNTDNDEAKSITDSLSAGFSATDTYEDTTEESSEESSEESQKRKHPKIQRKRRQKKQPKRRQQKLPQRKNRISEVWLLHRLITM